jgi:hypothetical protein
MMNRITWSNPTYKPLPTILIRGFGGLDASEEKKSTYYGFNDGTVYPQKQGENYIYEGLILRFMKSDWKYQDATNVIGYYSKEIQLKRDSLPDDRLKPFDEMGFFNGHKLVVDPAMALKLIKSEDDPRRTIWVFRYYDFDDRRFETYSNALVRLIDFIRALVSFKQQEGKIDIDQPRVNKVNIIAHSMGGLLIRHAIQSQQHGFAYSDRVDKTTADECINKIVTLGTPHQGISFQLLQNLRWLPFLEAGDELEQFNPENQRALELGFNRFQERFPLERLLTVVGTNYRTYNTGTATILNRLFPISDEYGFTYNRSDGLVKQAYAQIPGAPRAFVHKPHGGSDSLITARESFEIATRFFFGNIRARLRLVSAQIKSGKDFFGKSEFFIGVSIKPRGVDFELFHQSKEAENCYGPFQKEDLSDDPQTITFAWADDDRLLWEGYLIKKLEDEGSDLVMRLQFYVGERDVFGIGFSDKLIFHKDYFVRAFVSAEGLQLYQYSNESFAAKEQDESLKNAKQMHKVDQGWLLEVQDSDSFEGTFLVELEQGSEDGS